MFLSDNLTPLQSHRLTIDNLDAALIYLLAERFRCTQKVGELKARHNLPERDKSREAVQLSRIREIAQDARLDADFAEGLMRYIIDEVVRRHGQLRADRPR
ncbi:chorismate mutase [Pantoea sp. KPR_PJ]|uniref:chorismate mutase n=1 Tax=Pantoea sp. KPR_PJ TaxID=2738375 RepID=UPI003528CD4D